MQSNDIFDGGKNWQKKLTCHKFQKLYNKMIGVINKLSRVLCLKF